MLIDMHTHYLPTALMSALHRRQVAPRILQRDSKPFIEYGPGSGVPVQPVFHEPELILERMNEAGIDHSVLSVTIPGVDWLDSPEAEQVADESNAETAAIATRYPAQMSGLATVPLQDPERAVTVLKRAIDMGLRGAMIYSNVAGSHLDALERRSFFDAAAALDVPILLHPTYPLCAPTMLAHGMVEIAAFLFDTTTAALRLVFDGVYDRNPDFKFIVPHAGSLIPYFVGRIDQFGNAKPSSTGNISGAPGDHIRKFYVDTVCNWPPAVQLCLDFFGEDRVMFGSDHPFWPVALAKKTLEEMHLADGTRNKVQHLNAARLFRVQDHARGVG